MKVVSYYVSMTRNMNLPTWHLNISYQHNLVKLELISELNSVAVPNISHCLKPRICIKSTEPGIPEPRLGKARSWVVVQSAGCHWLWIVTRGPVGPQSLSGQMKKVDTTQSHLRASTKTLLHGKSDASSTHLLYFVATQYGEVEPMAESRHEPTSKTFNKQHFASLRTGRVYADLQPLNRIHFLKKKLLYYICLNFFIDLYHHFLSTHHFTWGGPGSLSSASSRRPGDRRASLKKLLGNCNNQLRNSNIFQHIPTKKEAIQ